MQSLTGWSCLVRQLGGTGAQDFAVQRILCVAVLPVGQILSWLEWQLRPEPLLPKLLPKARNAKTPADDVLGVTLRPGQGNLQHSALKASREEIGTVLVLNRYPEEHDAQESHANAKLLNLVPAASAPRSV